MPIFVLILVSAIALIAGLSVFFLRYLTEGRRLRAARAAIVLFDILGVGAMLFLFASHRTEGWAGMLALPIFLGCVAQIIALLLTMLAVLVRAAVRRMCRTLSDGGSTARQLRGIHRADGSRAP